MSAIIDQITDNHDGTVVVQWHQEIVDPDNITTSISMPNSIISLNPSDEVVIDPTNIDYFQAYIQSTIPPAPTTIDLGN